MEDSVLRPASLCQVAIVVRDIDQARRAWARILGVEAPPWRMTAPSEETHIQFRGRGTEARAKLAFFDLGDIRLELIEPVGRPSTWGEFLDTHGEGIHHIAFMVEGQDETLTQLAGRDVPLIQRGDYKGGRYAYVDGTSSLGTILELLENL